MFFANVKFSFVRISVFYFSNITYTHWLLIVSFTMKKEKYYLNSISNDCSKIFISFLLKFLLYFIFLFLYFVETEFLKLTTYVFRFIVKEMQINWKYVRKLKVDWRLKFRFAFSENFYFFAPFVLSLYRKIFSTMCYYR